MAENGNDVEVWKQIPEFPSYVVSAALIGKPSEMAHGQQ